MASLLGKVYKLYDSGNGYNCLILSVNLPFRTVFKKFSLFDSRKLVNKLNEPIRVGDDVEIIYSTDSKYPELLEIDTVFLETCNQCYGFRKQGDAQVYNKSCFCIILNE